MNSNLTYLLAQERASDFARSAEEARLAATSRPENGRSRRIPLLARLFQRRRYDVAQPAAIHSPAEDGVC
jgi:hypothetical protein